MTSVDKDIFPQATGLAHETVKSHADGGPDQLVFYAGWFCPFVQRVWIALEHKGIAYQYKEENPYHKDKDFLQISPKGLVPAMKYKGKPLHESLVMLEFLEDAYPLNKPLLPPISNPLARAEIRLAIDHISKAIVPACYKLLQAQGPKDQELARDRLTTELGNFARKIRGPFYAGDELTLADVIILPHIARLFILEEERGFDHASVGNGFEEYCARLTALPAFERTCSGRDKLKESYGRYLRNESQSEVAKATRGGHDLP